MAGSAGMRYLRTGDFFVDDAMLGEVRDFRVFFRGQAVIVAQVAEDTARFFRRQLQPVQPDHALDRLFPSFRRGPDVGDAGHVPLGIRSMAAAALAQGELVFYREAGFVGAVCGGGSFYIGSRCCFLRDCRQAAEGGKKERSENTTSHRFNSSRRTHSTCSNNREVFWPKKRCCVLRLGRGCWLRQRMKSYQSMVERFACRVKLFCGGKREETVSPIYG